MKNKGALIAGLGLGAALTLSSLAFSSANQTAEVDASANAMNITKMTMPMDGQRMMKIRHGEAMPAATMFMGRGGDKLMMAFRMPGGENSAMQTAIENNDYNAFIRAWNADENKPADAEAPTQEQFSQMVAMHQKHQTIQTAIENNDYEAYAEATKPTREEFDRIVTQHNMHKAIEAALEAKDYAAFQTAIKDTPMAEKMTETQFNAMVERREQMAEKFQNK